MKQKLISGQKIICLNRKASFNYFFLELLEAGISLKGSEVKSLRDGKGSIADSYALDNNGEMFLVNSQNSSTDCFGIQNGTALVDDCGICQQAYLYDFISHTVTFVTDTNNLNVTYPILLILPDDPSNPYWNSNCNDCNGIVNGTSLNDDCGECQQAYIYNFITHTPSGIHSMQN